MNFLKKYWAFLIILLFSWGAIRPLFHSGFFSMHDDTQVARVYEMAQALRDFQFPVRWVADLGYGFGYPIFNFYAPLPYYAGAIFNLAGFDVLTATKIMFFLGIILSGLFMYLLTREFLGRLGGILASLFYIYAPYHAVDIYVRGAVGEFWAMAFLPVLALGFYRVLIMPGKNNISTKKTALRELLKTPVWVLLNRIKINKEALKWVFVGGIGYAGLILSHNLTAMMTAPFIAITLLLIIYFAIKNKKLSIIYNSLFIILLALGLSAFYWLPAVLEMKFTNVASQIGGGADFRDHFVCIGQLWHSAWGFGGSAPGCTADGMSFQIGKLQIVLGLIVFLGSIFWWRRDRGRSRLVLSITTFLLLAVFLLTPYSQFLWESVSPMAYIQYPWRFLTFATFFISILAASFLLFFRNLFLKLTVFILILLMLVFYRAKYFKPQQYLNLEAKDYTNEETIKWRTSKISDEFLPRGFPIPQTPQEVAKDKIIALDKFAKISNLKSKSNYYSFDVESENENLILSRIANFPNWKVFVDGKDKTVLSIGGQMYFAVSGGKHKIEVVFKNTPVRIIGNTISVLTILLLIWGMVYVKKQAKD